MASITTISQDAPPVRKGRPESMMAQEFSLTLDNIFGLPSEQELALEQKRKSLHAQQTELAKLQARIKAMTEELEESGDEEEDSESDEEVERTTRSKPPFLQPIFETSRKREMVVGRARTQAKEQIVSSESEQESEEEEEDDEEEDSETEESSSEDEEPELKVKPRRS